VQIKAIAKIGSSYDTSSGGNIGNIAKDFTGITRVNDFISMECCNTPSG